MLRKGERPHGPTLKRIEVKIVLKWIKQYRQHGLEFIPLQEEHCDFIVPKARLERPAVRSFCGILNDPAMRERRSALEFCV